MLAQLGAVRGLAGATKDASLPCRERKKEVLQ
jgi:hypothetical protein